MRTNLHYKKYSINDATNVALLLLLLPALHASTLDFLNFTNQVLPVALNRLWLDYCFSFNSQRSHTMVHIG